VSEKKGATGQSFIRKEITTYRIDTLVINLPFMFFDNNFWMEFSILVHCAVPQNLEMNMEQEGPIL
jgi:hypothetical protein